MFIEARIGYSFDLPASVTKSLLVKAAFASDYLKLGLPMFVKCFLIFAKFQPHVSYRHVSYIKKHALHCSHACVV